MSVMWNTYLAIIYVKQIMYKRLSQIVYSRSTEMCNNLVGFSMVIIVQMVVTIDGTGSSK